MKTHQQALLRPHFHQRDVLPLLKVHAFYRISLAILLAGLFFSDFAPSLLGKANPILFRNTISLYLTITLVSLITLISKRFSPSDQHIFLICFIDITAITLLMHASGGVNSSLGLLLFVTISAGSIILTSQIANLLAALATIAIISESSYRLIYFKADTSLLLPAGMLGFFLFVTAQLFRYLSKRMQEASQEAEQESQRRIQAQQLNQLIVQRMRTGILILSPSGEIKLINEGAKKLLDLNNELSPEHNLNDMSLVDIPDLFQTFSQWKSNSQQKLPPIQLHGSGPELQISYAQIDQEKNTDIILFMEDIQAISQQAQQLKLASLGHLTANIAHEIRNPLGAISHAAQLLAESTSISSHDQRLTEIIQNHSVRVNQIIENVLQLSRRNQAQSKKISLIVFLEKFVNSYKQTHNTDACIDLCTENDNSKDIQCNFDSSHLEQVLTNLCDNGLRYSKAATGNASITLKAYIEPKLERPCLDVIDTGEGIPEENHSKIFEPFFTTDNSGTGLGLYLASELCKSNQATLDYTRNNNNSCFRIIFAHPKKLQ